jgi:ligand-binding sensor domain-containing protein
MITIRRAGTVPFILIVILALCARDSFSFSQFANYQSTIKVNDIVSSGLKTWVACSGGLFVIDYGNNSYTLFNDINHFPDVNLTAICRDPKGNLWIGSSLGYLYKQTPDGQNFIYNSYFGANWAIQALLFYKNYLLVGSSAGFSLFDPNKEQAIGNTSVIDTFSNQTVFTVAVHNDSLYLGCTDGFASACIAGDSLTKNNYADPSLWHSMPTGQKVASFIDSSGMFLARSDTAVFVGQTYYHANNFSDTFSVKVKDSVVFTFPSAVTKLIKDDFDNLWIGTEENYLYFWNHVNPAQVPTQVTIPGLTFDVVNRVHAARNGTVWLEPINQVGEPRWDGITSFDGKIWTLYNQYTTQNIGLIGDDIFFHGMCEDKSGTMWFGAPGGCVKRYDVQNKTWAVYYLNGVNFDTIRQLSSEEASKPGFWEKCDAIAQDSSGVLWFANWGNKTNNIKGSLICTDPSIKSYKRFFPYGDQYYIKDIISLCVDSRGKILAGGHDGELLIASPNGNPLQNGIDSVYLFRTDFGTVSDICATSNGISWIATGKGLYKYNSLTGILDSIPTSKIPATVNSVDAESDGVLWLGTSADGIMRYTVSDSTKTVFNMGNGLVSNAVHDLSIDKTGGYLWVATNAGLSRMSLGHTASAVADNKNIVAYPNPFSRKNPNHREIIFKHCAPGAKINVYTLRGALVKVLSSDADNAYPFDTGPFETTLRWVPSNKLVPGTYYFVGQPQQPAKTQKLLIVP